MKAHILYLFINFPFIWLCKIGITRRSAARRARQVDKSAPGIPIPVFILFAPFFAYYIEQFLHRLMDGLNIRYYKGDGSTEWFFILAALPALAVMVLGWMGWWWVTEFAYNKFCFLVDLQHKTQ